MPTDPAPTTAVRSPAGSRTRSPSCRTTCCRAAGGSGTASRSGPAVHPRITGSPRRTRRDQTYWANVNRSVDSGRRSPATSARTADRLIKTLGDEYYPKHPDRAGAPDADRGRAPAALVRYKAVFDPVAAEGYSAKSGRSRRSGREHRRAAAVGAVRLAAGHGPRPLAVHRRSARQRPRHPLTARVARRPARPAALPRRPRSAACRPAAPAGRRPCRPAAPAGRRPCRPARHPPVGVRAGRPRRRRSAPVTRGRARGRRCVAAAAVSASAASRARAAQSASDSRASVAPTSGSARADIDRLVMPSPTSTGASSGSAAASPHTPTGLPARRPASPHAATRDSNAGCHGSRARPDPRTADPPPSCTDPGRSSRC